MKRIYIILISLLFLCACAGQKDKVIKPAGVYTDDFLLCMQASLHGHTTIRETFKYDEKSPSMIIYPKDTYATLTEEEKEVCVEDIGRAWQTCYPNDYRPMTLWVHGPNGEIISVIFVIRE